MVSGDGVEVSGSAFYWRVPRDAPDESGELSLVLMRSPGLRGVNFRREGSARYGSSPSRRTPLEITKSQKRTMACRAHVLASAGRMPVVSRGRPWRGDTGHKRVRTTSSGPAGMLTRVISRFRPSVGPDPGPWLSLSLERTVDTTLCTLLASVEPPSVCLNAGRSSRHRRSYVRSRRIEVTVDGEASIDPSVKERYGPIGPRTAAGLGDHRMR